MSRAVGQRRVAADVPLPTGTVTFLLTDVEKSSRIWEQGEKGTAAKAVDRMYEILDEAIGRHGGARPVEQGEGDSVVGAFARASDAMAAALDAQRMLGSEDWPTSEPVRVRMALHTGEAQLRDEGKYFGPALNRCARLRELAHGGQVLLSHATHDLVADHLADGITLKDLGSHRLRDLGRPEQVFQLCHPGLAAEFPPLTSVDSVTNNLPAQVTSFIGREDEMQEVGRLLEETRLLTLTGAGGSGKTRLALQLAAQVLDAYPDGVWWVDLAPLTDPTLVPAVVATTLGIRESPVETIADTLVRRLAGRRLLVVLDNCEHLVVACATLAERLLQGCADPSIIATSREPLGIEGETTWRVPSLSVPEEEPDLESLACCEAVGLFVDRARRARPYFALTDDNASAVTEICRRLDGIPLAIELAASRTRVLAPRQIADGLTDRFHLLTGGARTALPRQRTLEASVDWSHDLLDDAQRTILRRLSVFAGSFTLDAAEAVCSGNMVEAQHVLDLISHLVDRSLVQVDDEEGPHARYRMLETIRDYARHKLTDAGEAETVRDRHLDFYLSVAEEAEPHLECADMLTWLGRLDLELDNLRAALDWSLYSGQPERGLRLVGLLWLFWGSRSDLAVGTARLEAPLARSVGDGSARGQALIALSLLAFRAGDMDKARSYAEEAAAIGRRLDDVRISGRALTLVGLVATWSETDAANALPLLDEAVELERRAQDYYCLSWTLSVIGTCYSGTTLSSRARGLLEEGLAIARASGALPPRVYCLYFLGSLDLSEGRFDAAASHLDEGLELARDIGDPWAETNVRCFLSVLHIHRGRYEDAGRECRLGLAQALEEGNPLGEAIMRLALGWLRFAEGHADDAAIELNQAFGLLSLVLPRVVWSCRANQSEVELARGRVNEATHYADEALPPGSATGEVQVVATALRVQAGPRPPRR